MKFFLTAMLLISAIFVSEVEAKEKKGKKEKQDPKMQEQFAGVWQMHMISNESFTVNPMTGEMSMDTTKLQPSNFYKFFGKGGDFNAVFIAPVLSLVTIAGTCEIYPGKYVENVGYHSNPAYANRKVELNYEFHGKNHFITSYKNEAGSQSYEVWKRLKQGDVATEITKLMDEGKIKLNE